MGNKRSHASGDEQFLKQDRRQIIYFSTAQLYVVNRAKKNIFELLFLYVLFLSGEALCVAWSIRVKFPRGMISFSEEEEEASKGHLQEV